MFTVTKRWLQNLTIKEWNNFIFMINSSAYFSQRYWKINQYFSIFSNGYSSFRGTSLIINFLNNFSDNEEIEKTLKDLIKLIFRKSKDYDIREFILLPTNENFFLPIAEENDLMLSEEDINEQDIEMMKKKFSIIADGKYSDLYKVFSQLRDKHQQEITNLQQAHEEFLDTQLNFYQQTKPELWKEFENSNPPALDVGNLLNFLESQLNLSKEVIKKQKDHLQNLKTNCLAQTTKNSQLEQDKTTQDNKLKELERKLTEANSELTNSQQALEKVNTTLAQTQNALNSHQTAFDKLNKSLTVVKQKIKQWINLLETTKREKPD